MLPTSLNVIIMLVGYLLVMAYLALGLHVLRRHPAGSEPTPRADVRRAGRFDLIAARRGWPGLIRQVVGTAVGGYLLLMVVVVGYYYGVARLGGRFLVSAFSGAALLVGVAGPVFFIASWLVERRRRNGSGDVGKRVS